MKFRLSLLIGLIAALCVVVTPVIAQNGTGNITGRVTDSSGAVVDRAAVSAQNVATGVRISATTNSAGIYLLQELIPGTYSLEVSKAGFKKVARPNILLQVSDNLGIDFKLEVGAISETVTVTAEAPQLRTEDAQTGEVVNEHMIESLVQLDRDPLKLLTLAGDVQGSGARAGWNLSAIGGNWYSGPADTRINGGRPGGVEYLIDGVPATGAYVHNVTNATPTMDDVQEFKVITNGISSEYGRLSGGVVEVSTKSGSNTLHGQVFEYHKDNWLNANSYQNDSICSYNGPTNAACKKAVQRQNRFGFAIGGPVDIPHVYDGKDKTFFFANAEWLRYSSAGNNSIFSTISDKEKNSFTSPVPCPDGTAGGCVDLTDIGTQPYDPTNPNFLYPFATLGDPYVTNNQLGGPSQTICNTYYGPSSPFGLPAISDPEGCLYPSGGDGRHIPISEIPGPIFHYVSSTPGANLSPIYGGTGGNYQAHQPTNQKTNSWDVRIDHVINPKQRIYGRFAYHSESNFTAGLYPDYASSGAQGKGAFSTSLHYNYTISPTFLLDLTAGGNYSNNSFGNYILSGPNVSTQGWGFAPSVTSIMGNNLTSLGQIWAEGRWSNGITLDQAMIGPSSLSLATTNFVYSAALTKTMNRHALKFGYEARRYYDNANTSAGSNGDGFYITPQGASELQSVNNNGTAPWGNNRETQDNIGTFFYGFDTWAQNTAPVSRDLATNYYAAYLQDDFSVTAKLKVNVGIRWEMQTPVTERHNNISVWDPLAPSPFAVTPAALQAYAANWTTNLETINGWTPAQAAQVALPSWLQAGAFPSGAQEFVATAQHRSRGATESHPWNFAPRLGFAYQALPKTVVRGSFGMFYLPTGGNISDYGDAPGVAYSNMWSSTNSHPQNLLGSGLQTVANPYNFPTTELVPFSRDFARVNQATAINGNGTGGIWMFSHMPLEYDWSLGIEHQLPARLLLEATYAGNYSNSLFGVYNPSPFPAPLYVPSNSAIYSPSFNGNNVCTSGCNVSPTAGLITPGLATNYKTGDVQPLGMLEYPYPYFGQINAEDANIGTNHFESLNVRVQKKMSYGFQALLNYTFSKDLDDTGAANEGTQPNNGGFGTNGKAYQSVLGIHSVYGLSAADQKHRVSAFYDYQLPFGRGRHWMANPQGIAGNILEGAAGGWEISGTTIWHTGTPVPIQVPNTQVDQDIDIWTTFGVFAPGADAKTAVGSGRGKSALCNIYCASQSTLPSNVQFALNKSAILEQPPNSSNYGAYSFTLGNIPPNLGNLLREPSNWTTDIAIMKNFAFSQDRSRYLEFRMEAQNIFNHPGLGNYDNNVGDTTYGTITGCDQGHCTANPERQLQVSARFIF